MMQHKGYTAKIEFDPDSELLHGEVLGIRDVVTFQARSVKALRKAFRDSVDDYLAFCKARGEAPEKPRSGNFVVRVDSELHRKAEMLAKASGRSLNSWIADCLHRELSRTIPRKKTRAASRFDKRTRRRAA
jgi:predicted HicB family RNase H-like nuclease